MSTSAVAALELIESAKRAAGQRAVAEHFTTSFRFVGIGSGTTIQYVVEAIAEECKRVFEGIPPIFFVPTGYQSRTLCEKAGLMPVAFDSLPEDQMLDVAFDGADEVDEDFNCVKGGGACLFQEKLVASRAKKFICVADFRKDVPRLLTTWTYIPIEVAPIAVKTVIRALKVLGSPDPVMRTLQVLKEGPLKTDQDFFIVKAPFPPLLLKKDDKSEAGKMQKTAAGPEGKVWAVEELAAKIKLIAGVLEVGIFTGQNGPETMAAGGQGGQKPIAVYFGMEDGTVKVNYAKGI